MNLVNRYTKIVNRSHMEWVNSPLYTHVRARMIGHPLSCALQVLCYPVYLFTTVFRLCSILLAYAYKKRVNSIIFLLPTVNRGLFTIA